jgi:FMN reductase
MKVTVLSCSLDPRSKSRILADACKIWIQTKGWEILFLDMRDYPLPDFDNDTIFQNANYSTIKHAIQSADSIIIASSVYNWSLSSTLKKVIEATGSHSPGSGITSAWFDKIVTFVCVGGLHHSYMAYSPVAASLMMDFKCIINPHIVYAVGGDFDVDGTMAPDIVKRIDKVMRVMAELTERLAHRDCLSTWEV